MPRPRLRSIAGRQVNAPCTPASEDPNIERCRHGDPVALHVVLSEHLPRIQRTLLRLVGPSADREDVLQLVLLAAMQSFKTYRGDSQLSTWLLGITVRVARSHLRSAYARRRVAIEMVPPLENAADGRVAPDQSVEDRRLLSRVYVHLSALGDKQREAFVLHVLEGYSIAELAPILGSNPMTVKSRVFLARRALMARVKRDPVLREALEAVLRGEGRERP